MSTTTGGGEFGNPLRKFKLVFLGEQSGEWLLTGNIPQCGDSVDWTGRVRERQTEREDAPPADNRDYISECAS